MDARSQEEVFMESVDRVNRYLIIMGIFFLIYFLIKSKTDKFLFLLALSNMGFVLLSHKLLCIARKVTTDLKIARALLKEYASKANQ